MKARPNYLHELGIARAASFGLPPSASSSQGITHHSFRFETDANLAAKRTVNIMWHDENAFEAASSMPDSPSKSRKGSSAASVHQTASNLSVLIEHSCGTKKIDMVFDEKDVSCPLQDLLIDKLPAEKSPGPALSLFQIQRMQSSMSSACEDISSHEESSVSAVGSLACFLACFLPC